MNPRLLFIASCLALITSAFTFVIRGDIAPDLGREFQLSQGQVGFILGAAFWGMFASMLLGSPLCDLIGMKRILILAFCCHVIGVLGTIFAPHDANAQTVLFIATLLAGCGNGLVEVAINPLAATLYPTQKTHYLNILHAWWPGGLILGGLTALFIGPGINWGTWGGTEHIMGGLHFGWQARMALILIPAFAYILLCLTQTFPETERVASGITNSQMFSEVMRPMFLLWGVCMLLTASTELGPQQWQESVMKATTNGAVSGTMILVYTSSMMFVLRHFAGPLAHAFSPVGMLTISAILSGIGLRLLSFATTPMEAFGYATIFGLGIAYFWPTMLGVTAERFPKGGAFLLGLMGAIGNLSIALILPVMGYTYDDYAVKAVPEQFQKQVVISEDAPGIVSLFGISTVQKLAPPDKIEALSDAAKEAVKKAQAVGAAQAFRMVSWLPLALVVIFSAIALYDKARGGYKAEILISRKEEDELFSGGVQAPVE